MNAEATIWYKTTPYGVEITPVEATKVTEKQITYRQWDDWRKKFIENRCAKMSDYAQFFPTWDQAHQDLLQRTERKIEAIKGQLESCEDKLRKIQSMTHPKS